MDKKNLKVLSWNVNGVQGRTTDIHYYVSKHNVDVILLQETGDRNGTMLKINTHTNYHLFADKGIRGLSTYIRKSIPSELVENPHKTDGVESLAVKLHLKEGVLNIVNLYISKNCFSISRLPDTIYNDATLIAGDFNARHADLEANGKTNDNGRRFNQFLNDYPDSKLLGTNEATHLMGGRLDYAVILNGQGLDGTCEVMPELLSDHFSLAISMPLGKLNFDKKRKRITLPKDKMDFFISGIDNWHRTYSPSSVEQFSDDLVNIIEQLLGSNKQTPKRHHASHIDKYYNDKILKEWTRMLRRAQKKWTETKGDEASRIALVEAAKICSQTRKETRSEYWKKFANRIGSCKNVGEIWKEVNKVRGKKVNSVAHPEPDKQADHLMDKWAYAASSDSLPQDVREAVKGWEEKRRSFILSSLNTEDVSGVEITKDEMLRSIKTGKSTAPGEDGITYEVVNCLASIDNGPLLQLFNMSLKEGKLPRTWKKAIIIPIPKNNGDFRPVSLTSCFSKMMERIILDRLLYVLGESLSSNLFGFRKGKGTSDAVIKCLSSGNDYCRTFIDLKGAFDKANGEVIMYELASLGVKGNLLQWIGDYVTGRRAQVWFQGSLSHEKMLELGTPQGGVLSPTLFNVLMNKIGLENFGNNVSKVIYADDILLQSNSICNMQVALNKFGMLARKMGLVINEEKTKFQCRSMGEKHLLINGKKIERVRSYKYLGMYIGYKADSKDTELHHILTQCKARLQPLKSLAWSGAGAGVPVLRMMYLTTIRSVIDYASPVLAGLGEGRLEKLEKIQNEAMRVILHCPPNAMICAMRVELSLKSLRNRVEELNITAAIRHVRSGSGNELSRNITGRISNPRAFRKQCKQGYLTSLVENVRKYNLATWCKVPQRVPTPPPWEEVLPNINIIPLTKKKCMYDTGELKTIIEGNVSQMSSTDDAHVYCDGSVTDTGRAGCGVLVIDKENSEQVESEYYYRITDNVSSTLAELCAILYGLLEIRNGRGDVHFFVDSRSALESLVSRNPVHNDIADQCRAILTDLKKRERKITFTWIPSHVGIINNERADKLAKLGTEKEIIDLECMQSLKQLKSMIQEKQNKEEIKMVESRYSNSETFGHYIKVLHKTDFIYGRSGNTAKDSLCTRLRLGYKYLWQLGVQKTDDEICCKFCKEPRSHTMHHYVLQCPRLTHCRNPNINDITDQVVWMFNNKKVEELAKMCKNIRELLR